MSSGALTRDRDFLKLWGGQAISKIGSTITSVGLPLTAAYVLGASPLQMGILAGSSGAGVLVFGLFAGAWADRLRRRPILIAADLARAALLATIPLAAVHAEPQSTPHPLSSSATPRLRVKKHPSNSA